MRRDLGDVQEAVSTRKNLYKSAKLSEPNHLAQIRLSNLGHRCKVTDHLNRASQTIGIARGNIHPSRIVNIDLHTGRIDNAANNLAARSDEVANLVRRNLNCMNARCKLRFLFTRARDNAVHRIQQKQPSVTCLLQSLPHDLRCNAHDLDIHLERGDALPRSSNLEIHVAVVVLSPRNARKDCIPLPPLHETHPHTGNRARAGRQNVRNREDPLSSRKSEKTRSVYGDSSSPGNTASIARYARAP